jgi:hypothetical protein
MPILPKSRTQSEISAVVKLLAGAVESTNPEECRTTIQKAIARLKRHGERLDQTASKLGSKGGKKTAERGPDYFRQIAAMRKNRSGGRPRKQAE